MILMKVLWLQSAFGLWHNSSILQMVVFIMTLFCCHKFFSSIFLCVMSLAFLLLRGGGARYCNKLALSSLVNNHYGTNR
jgi:hypothetical protein